VVAVTSRSTQAAATFGITERRQRRTEATAVKTTIAMPDVDLFEGCPPSRTRQTEPRYDERAPGLYADITATCDRALLCAVGVEVLAETPTDEPARVGRLFELLRKRMDAATDPLAQQHLRGLLIGLGRQVHGCGEFLERLRARRAQLARSSA
jgi:hypothetical protein